MVLRPAAARPSFLIFSFSFSSPFPSAGDVTQLRLPEGMQRVDFYNCQRLTGTAELGYMSEVHICLIRFYAVQPHALPHSSSSHFLSPSILPFSQGISGR
jgi:hypothetical protein